MCVVTELPALIPAVLWTRKDIREFKDSLRKNADNILRVSSLSVATVSIINLALSLLYTLHKLADSTHFHGPNF